jgi:hypothetical protein
MRQHSVIHTPKLSDYGIDPGLGGLGARHPRFLPDSYIELLKTWC